MLCAAVSPAAAFILKLMAALSFAREVGGRFLLAEGPLWVAGRRRVELALSGD